MPSRERPILFSGGMIRAILAGRKSQTRRLYKPRRPAPYEVIGERDDDDATWPVEQDEYGDWHVVGCPYGVPGDRLWVREAFAIYDMQRMDYRYGALKDHAKEHAWAKRRVTVGGERCLEALVIYGANPRSTQELDALNAQVARNEHGGQDFSWTWMSHLPTSWRPSIFMPRWASRITLEVTEVRVQRLQDISEEDARAEGVEPAIDLMRALGEGRHSSSYQAGFKHIWDAINGDRAPWSANPWVWAVSFKRVQP